MNKQEILDYLKEKNVLHEVTEHKAVYNMEEVSQIDIPIPKRKRKIFLSEMIRKEIIIL